MNADIPQNGEGTVNITFTIRAGSPGRIRLSDLDITYRYQTRVISASLDGGMLVPDGVDRILVTQLAIGDDAGMLQRVDVTLGSSHGEDPQFCDGLLEIHALSYPTLQTLYDLILAIVLLWSVREISSVSVCPFSLNGSGMTKTSKPTSVLSMIRKLAVNNYGTENLGLRLKTISGYWI